MLPHTDVCADANASAQPAGKTLHIVVCYAGLVLRQLLPFIL